MAGTHNFLLPGRQWLLKDKEFMVIQQTHGHKKNTLGISVSPEIQGQRA